MSNMKNKKFNRSKVKNAKKSTYDGHNFQSNLELYCYKELEKAKILVEYEASSLL